MRFQTKELVSNKEMINTMQKKKTLQNETKYLEAMRLTRVNSKHMLRLPINSRGQITQAKN